MFDKLVFVFTRWDRFLSRFVMKLAIGQSNGPLIANIAVAISGQVSGGREGVRCPPFLAFRDYGGGHWCAGSWLSMTLSLFLRVFL